MTTRARLLRAAKAVFEEDGFLDATIAAITARAGVSHGSFYHYFDSKTQIFREVAETVGDLFQESARTSMSDLPPVASPAEAVWRMCRHFLASYRDEARILGVIEIVARQDAKLAGIQCPYGEPVRAHLARALHQMRPQGGAGPDIDPAIALLAMSAMMNRFAEMWFVENLFECDFDEGVDQLSRICLNALRLDELTDFRAPGADRTTIHGSPSARRRPGSAEL